MFSARGVAVALPLLLGIAIFAMIEAFLGHHARNCTPQQHSSSHQTPTDKSAPTANKGEKGTEQGKHESVSEPFVCTLDGLPTAIRMFMNHNEGFFVGGFTFVLAFITAWLVWATLGLRGSTDKLWQATIDADEARARDTQILQRAYISVEPAGISASTDIAKCHPLIVIKNVGNLPAKDVCWFIEWAVSLDDRRSTFALNLEKLEGEVTLTPGAQMQQGGPIVYVGDDPGDLKSQRGLYLYVWGLVRYDNGFGKSRRTQFCHRYNAANLEQIRNEFVRSDGTTSVGYIVGHRIDVAYARVHRHGNNAS